MFVPSDLLPSIMAELMANGRTPGPGRPWLGVTADEVNGELRVARVTVGGPGTAPACNLGRPSSG